MSSRRSLVLGLVGTALLVGIVMLLLEVKGSPATEIDEEKLEAAEASYRRAQAAAQRAGAEPGESVPMLPPRPSLPEVEADVAEAPPPERVLPIERRNPPRLRNPTVATLDQAKAVGMQGDSLKDSMDGVNSLYDKAEYERARESALEVLEEHPKQVRMLRVVVSTSCLMGDEDVAAKYFERLERDRDRRQMARRCSRYGVELEP